MSFGIDDKAHKIAELLISYLTPFITSKCIRSSIKNKKKTTEVVFRSLATGVSVDSSVFCQGIQSGPALPIACHRCLVQEPGWCIPGASALCIR